MKDKINKPKKDLLYVALRNLPISRQIIIRDEEISSLKNDILSLETKSSLLFEENIVLEQKAAKLSQQKNYYLEKCDKLTNEIESLSKQHKFFQQKAKKTIDSLTKKISDLKTK